MQLYIPIILGTGRAGRHTEHAARFVLTKTQEVPNLQTELVDVRDFRLPATDDSETTPLALKWREKMERADGLIIVAPEYNHGYPGELKMMLDLIYDAYARKPIAICGTGGSLGGSRMIEQLRLIAIELKMVPLNAAIHFANIKTLFDNSGVIQDPSYARRVQKLLEELIWYAQALKTARQQPHGI